MAGGWLDFIGAALSARRRRLYVAARMPAVAARKPSALLKSCAGLGITSLVCRYAQAYEIEIDTRAGHIAVAVLKTGAFQPEVMEVLAAALGDRRPLFVNVGANIGTTLLNAHRRGFARLVGIEPVARNFALLEGNMARNGIDARLHRMALGRAAGTLEINLDPRNAGGHSFHALPGAQGTERVAVGRLDALDLAEPFVLWMDTEGFEAEVLAGAGPELLARHCAAICVELSPLHSGPGPALEVLDLIAGLFPRLTDGAGAAVDVPALRARIAAGAVGQIDLVGLRVPAGPGPAAGDGAGKGAGKNARPGVLTAP
ncbi:FkbM family methyltransferase [Frigidibacter sp. MR17.24]|uniref:FkbM family methyltransferase n=1 Tax=Frigidibacter sp. MR17.24 TaxID=3127345 RepID=UPI0030129E77